jgi:hypothetical protein
LVKKQVSLIAFAIVSFLFLSVAAAQSNPSPTIFLSTNEVSFFNGEQDSLDVTVKNNDGETHTFSISVFPSSLDKVFASPSLNHITLNPSESGTFKITFTSLFEAEFMPRQFSVTLVATDDPSLTATKEVFVNILRRSPVFVLSLTTNKFSYQPGDNLNITSVVVNQGADNFDEYLMQTTISKGGEILRRFESTISYLPQKSQTTYSNLYTFEQFTDPGVYTVQITLKDSKGQIVSSKSINLRVGEVDKASQQENVMPGILDITTVLSTKNEGNAPADLTITTVVGPIARDLFVSDIEPISREDLGNSVRMNWVFDDVQPGDTVQVVTKIEIWKIWMTILIIFAAGYLSLKFIFKVKITKRARYFKALTKDSEIPVSIEIVNRSIGEVKDLVVKDFIPPIAKIVPKFETVKPITRETISGTEVVWKFDSLRAGEERVMAYKIKPKMDIIGSLRLNPAILSYSSKDRKKKSTASGMVIVQPE